MPIKPLFNDDIRLNILKAMKEKGTIKPDLTLLHEKTKMSIVTIKRALQKMEQKKHFNKFYPILSAKNTGFDVLALIFLQVDSSKQKNFESFLEFCKNEKRIISVHRIIGSGKWNILIRSLTKNLENFDTLINNPKKPLLNPNFVINSLFFFSTEPILINNKRAYTISNILIQDSENKKTRKYLTPKRKKLLNCFAEGTALRPNIKQIQKITNLHATTIKSSLKFLENEKILQGYAPSINFDGIGVNNHVFDFFKINYADTKNIENLTKILKTDKNIFHAGSIYGDGKHNLLIIHAYQNIETYQSEFRKKYLSDKDIYQFLESRMTFFATSSPIETKSRWPCISTTILDILLDEHGIK
jgi:DNA-binding Lrp family transcriptional regulator